MELQLEEHRKASHVHARRERRLYRLVVQTRWATEVTLTDSKDKSKSQVCNLVKQTNRL